MKTYIFAMSKSKSDIWNDLDNHAFQLIEHLLKCYYFHSYGNYDHWKDECFSFIHNISKLKLINKYPKKEFILDGLLSNYQDDIDALAQDQIYRYSKRYTKDEMPECVDSYILDYMDWLADSLHSCGRVSAVAVNHKIDELIEKYSHMH